MGWEVVRREPRMMGMMGSCGVGTRMADGTVDGEVGN